MLSSKLISSNDLYKRVTYLGADTFRHELFFQGEDEG